MEEIIEEQETDIEEQIQENTSLGGSGKTFIYTTLYYLLRNKGKVVSTMAFTGIAATLLPSGKTVHKVFGLPVLLFNDSTSNIKIQSKEDDKLKLVNVFILDEAPMAPRYVIEIMDRTLRDIIQNDLYFGRENRTS
ncbi:ATP-dependent DNA helicase pif1-like [Monomorium pharaonis]|uniref:ATP-dependent DNA helicase pif1-like n=1 Tax=Monomorium pharaonis TaxID=307658 RepID=UPI001747C772|nr:ATP-dependent DNA helicase pif1-like [Monomorium pharaonis]